MAYQWFLSYLLYFSENKHHLYVAVGCLASQILRSFSMWVHRIYNSVTKNQWCGYIRWIHHWVIFICVHCWRKLLAATVYCWSQGGNGCDSTRHRPWSAGNIKPCPTVLYYLSCGGDCREELWNSSRIKSCLFLLEVNSFLTLSCTVGKAKEVSDSWPVATQCDIFCAHT